MIGYYIISYVYFINVLTFSLYGADKHFSVSGKRRIPEAVLLCLSVIGGALGALLGMLLFRHKTNHKVFYIVNILSFVLLATAMVLMGYVFDILPEICFA